MGDLIRGTIEALKDIAAGIDIEDGGEVLDEYEEDFGIGEAPGLPEPEGEDELAFDF